MCEGASGTEIEAALVAPRPALGEAIDPIGVEPVDEVIVTTLVDNVYDALLPDDERTTRASFGVGSAEAP
jgi:7,8-dihydropterin-6-yl-methyl-4-(beta-D-ribofuranosyl)aminobenzene 5'-phosphate synthase